MREALLRYPLIPRSALVPSAIDHLDAQLAELAIAADHGLWKAVTFLASQITEALLRIRLASHPTSQVQPTAGMANLISLARRAGILPARFSGTESLSAALTIRNWAAHFDLLSAYPDERRATQAIALMVCAAEILFPMPRIQRTGNFMVEDFSLWSEYAPGVVFRRLRHDAELRDSDAVRLQMPELVSYVASGSSLRCVYGLSALLRDYGLSQDILKVAIENNFVFIVRRSWFAAEKTIRELVWLVRKLGLRDHAFVMSILLPLDPAFLLHAIRRRRPAHIAFYLRDARNADRDLYAWKMNKLVNSDDFLLEFWTTVSERNLTAADVGPIVVQNDDAARARFVATAPKPLLEGMLSASELRLSIPLLRCVRARVIEQYPDAAPAREVLINGAKQASAANTLWASRDVVQLFFLFKMIDDPICTGIVAALLSRIIETGSWEKLDWRAGRRIAWEAYAYMPALRDTAITAADSVFATMPPGLSAWDFATAAGTLCFAGRPPDIRTARPRILAPAVGGNWYNALALLAIRTFPSKLVEGAPGAFTYAIQEFAKREKGIADIHRRLAESLGIHIEHKTA